MIGYPSIALFPLLLNATACLVMNVWQMQGIENNNNNKLMQFTLACCQIKPVHKWDDLIMT